MEDRILEDLRAFKSSELYKWIAAAREVKWVELCEQALLPDASVDDALSKNFIRGQAAECKSDPIDDAIAHVERVIRERKEKERRQ